MTYNELLSIIKDEQLEKYNRFYTVMYRGGENCICIQKNDNNTFSVLAMGERGNVAFEHLNISENNACDIVLKYLRFNKEYCLRCQVDKNGYPI